jgi:galactonate dehydratase
MRIQKLETLRVGEFPNLLWLRVHTDEGLVGLGETSYAAQSVEAYVHEYVAPRVLGRDPLEIEALTRSLIGYLGWRGSGVETRAASAFDIALWDLYGKVCGQPLYQVLGGASRSRVRTYNTCAGYRYIRAAGGQSTRNWGLDGKAEGPFEDLDAFLHRADELAQSLLESGITGMKIWPFDPYAEASEGQYISAPDLERALEPFRKIRAAVATGWTSWSSFIPSGVCFPRSVSRRRLPSSTRSGTKTRSAWTASRCSSNTRRTRRRRSAPRRSSPADGGSRICSRPA